MGFFSGLIFSFSRLKQLYACPRSYYYSHYGANNGWRQDAPLRTKQIYKLKKLQSTYALVGESLHSSAKEIILNPNLNIVDFKKSTNRKIKDNYKKSLTQKDEWSENPRLFTMLSEIYYSNEVTLEMQQKVINKIDNCGNNLIKSRSYQELVNNADIISLDDLAEVGFDTFKTSIRCDALYREGGRIIVVDWKTGNASEGDLEQVLLYVYFVSKLYNVPAEEIEARLEYLSDGDFAVYNFSRTDMECAEEIVRRGVDELQNCLANRAKNLPYPEVYFKQNISSKCRYCNFKEICFNGGIPLIQFSEHPKDTDLVKV